MAIPKAPDGKSRYLGRHANSGVQAITDCLEQWLSYLDERTETDHLPDLNYPKTWSEEQVERVIFGIDEEINREVASLPGTDVGADVGPEYKRLEYPQRLALIQEIDTIFSEYQQALLQYQPRPATADTDPMWDMGYWGYDGDYFYHDDNDTDYAIFARYFG